MTIPPEIQAFLDATLEYFQKRRDDLPMPIGDQPGGADPMQVARMRLPSDVGDDPEEIHRAIEELVRNAGPGGIEQRVEQVVDALNALLARERSSLDAVIEAGQTAKAAVALPDTGGGEQPILPTLEGPEALAPQQFEVPPIPDTTKDYVLAYVTADGYIQWIETTAACP